MKDKSSNAGTQGSHNHGTHKSGNLRVDFGLDRSSYAGSAKHERGGNTGGGTSNLSHSLQGTSANQKLKG